VAVSTNDSVEEPKRAVARDAAKLIRARRGGYIAGAHAQSPLPTSGCCGEPAGALAGPAVASCCCGEPAGSGELIAAGSCCGEPTVVASGQPHLASQSCCGEAAGSCCG